MEGFSKSFFQNCFEEVFGDYASDVCKHWEDCSSEYKSLVEERKNIKQVYPKIEALVETEEIEEITTLTSKEAEKLREYLECLTSINYHEMMALYLAGARETVLTLQMLGLLKKASDKID